MPQDRAIKIVLYQCEAQAHFYAHLAFSSTDGRNRVSGQELRDLIEHPEKVCYYRWSVCCCLFAQLVVVLLS